MNMIERIARAIDPRAWDNDGPLFDMKRAKARRQATTAIKEMRDPTPEMIEAVDSSYVSGSSPAQNYSTMIDAALNSA